MFVAIVIDVIGLGFVGGAFPSSSNDKGVLATDLAVRVDRDTDSSSTCQCRHNILS